MPMILLLCLVQFISILDFMIVMPLGPDFSSALGIDPSHIGLVAGTYTGAAALSGVICSSFLDRYDRKKALLSCFFGLCIGTLLCGYAWDLNSMLMARFVAGAFGGPATALVFAIVSDQFPPEKRGRALGTVMASFSIASILGVPAGLELAHRGTWQTPFQAVTGLGLVVWFALAFLLPSMRQHLSDSRSRGAANPIEAFKQIFGLLRNRSYFASVSMTFFVMMASFLVIPNIASFVQLNMHFPRERLGELYLVGGISSFLTMNFAGRLADRIGSFRIADFGTLGMVFFLFASFVVSPSWIPPYMIFIGFMVSTSMRGIALSTTAARVPAPHERARFMSLQSAIQHIATSLGAIISASILTSEVSGEIQGMPIVASMSIVLCIIMPVLLRRLDRLIVEHKNAVTVTESRLAV
jgi:predicted MFS family arabinose efflux permease